MMNVLPLLGETIFILKQGLWSCLWAPVCCVAGEEEEEEEEEPIEDFYCIACNKSFRTDKA